MPDFHDIPRLYTGIAEILACFLYGELNGAAGTWRSRLGKLAAGLVCQCLFLVLTRNLPLFLWLAALGAAFSLMYFFLSWICPLDRISRMYLTIRAFVLAEFVASAQWQFYAIAAEIVGENRALQDGSMVALYGLFFYGAYRFEKHLKRPGFRPVYSWSETFAAGLIGLAIFTSSNMGFLVYMLQIGFLRLDIFNTRTLIDLGGLAVLYAFQFRVNELQAQKDLAALNTGLHMQYDSYRNYQETMELMNIRYHDLKHQAMLLRAETDPQRRETYLDEMERELEELRPQQQTGSRVLDIILAGKSMKMRNSGIQFTCVADGSLLENMHVTDICTIFGNALDNAIEHVAQIEDPQKRIISMSLSRRKDFIYMEFSNYCESSPQLRDGIPVTTKINPANAHGYGIRSIIYTARKYGGEAAFEEKNHFFLLKILIPVREPSS